MGKIRKVLIQREYHVFRMQYASATVKHVSLVRLHRKTQKVVHWNITVTLNSEVNKWRTSNFNV